MTENDAIQKLQAMFNFRIEDKSLLLLHSIKHFLEDCDDNMRLEVGLIIIGLASFHELTDDQLLEFFNTTMEAVKGDAGEEVIQEHGLYRTLVTSPTLSPICELFFSAWFAVYYRDNALGCRIRRIGLNAYKLVAMLPNDTEREYHKTITAEEALRYTNCTIEDLIDMPILN